MLTYANALTAFRIAAAPLVAALLICPEHPAALPALAVMLLAELSDLLDGHVARRTNQVSAAGKILDPMADAFYRGIVFTAFAFNGWISVWLLLPMLGRDLAVAGLREYAESRSGTVAARMSGKIKAIVQGAVQIAIVAAIAGFGETAWSGPVFSTLMLMTVIVTLYSLVDYIAALPRKTDKAQTLPALRLALSLSRLLGGIVCMLLIANGGTAAVLACIVLIALNETAEISTCRCDQSEADASARTIDAVCGTIFHAMVFLAFMAAGWIPLWVVIAIYGGEIALPYLRSFATQMKAPSPPQGLTRIKITFQGMSQIVVIALVLARGPHVHLGDADATLMIYSANVALSLAVFLQHFAPLLRAGRNPANGA